MARVIRNASDDSLLSPDDVDHMDLLREALATLSLAPDPAGGNVILKTFLSLSAESRTLHKDQSIREKCPSVKNSHLRYSKTLPRGHKLSARKQAWIEMMDTASSVWFFKRTASRRHWLLDLWGSKKQPRSPEDDNDSGYHTGSSTLKSRGQKPVKKSPGQWTLTREELRRNIEIFNNNNHGLIMSLQPDTNTFQGFIRVHMNLIRPINMSLSTRPPSIYDVIGQGDDEEGGDDDSQITSFYLPKDTTKVIHINSNTTTQEVIKALLSKFKITDNPRKFALYEKIIDVDKATMRRLEDDEMPLPLCLCWTKDGVNGLDKRKFVLQENDTGEIMWEAFSLPELENFLKILNREEEEYVEQVRCKYRMLKIHMERRLKELCPNETTITDDKRTPVFV